MHGAARPRADEKIVSCVVAAVSKAARDAAGAQAPAEERAVVPECAAMKAELLARVAALALPPNFLDHMIDELGGPKARPYFHPRITRLAGLHAERAVQGT
jgi:hypothetical protein